jgi:hypothetical protein
MGDGDPQGNRVGHNPDPNSEPLVTRRKLR